jgi:hypothetical protein
MSRIFMAFRGVEGDQRLFFASSLDDSFSGPLGGPHNRPDLNSSLGPALAVFNNRLFMAWKGVEGDQRLFLASGPVSASGIDLSKFSGPLNRSDQNTSQGPALAVFNGRLFVAWKGVEGDQRLFWASSPDGVEFDGGHNRGDFNSSQGPALAVFNGRLFMAWRGAGLDSGLFLASSDGNNFGDKQQRFLTGQRPALTVFGSSGGPRLLMAWTSATSHNLQWASSPNGGDWDGPIGRPDNNSTQGPALTVLT